MSPMGECWKTSAALNLKIDNRLSSVYAGSQGSELDIGGESEVLLMQMPYKLESTCSSSAAESVSPVMGSSLPSSGDLICSGFKARAEVGVANPWKIKSPQISAT